MWNPERGNAPPNFLAALYGEEDEDDDINEDEDIDELEYVEDVDQVEEFVDEEMEDNSDGEASPTPPSYSPITIRGSSPMEHQLEPEDRCRSRSPLHQPEPAGVVLAIYDESGAELTAEPMDLEFHVPDSHVLYECGESSARESMVVERGGRGRAPGRRGGRRGGGRGRSRGQLRGRGGGRGRRQATTTWEVGQPLEQVWLTDEDVSPELRDMVRDVIRRRQERLEEVRLRNERRRNSEVRNEEENSEGEHDDVFEDANDGRGNALLEGVDSHFEWCPMDTFRVSPRLFASTG